MGATLLFLLITTLSLGARPTVSPGCGGPTFVQDDRDGNGLVVMEAERPTSSRASNRAGHSSSVDWWEYTLNSASNGGYVKVPTTGQNAFTTPFDGARLEFEIEFSRTGTHYLDLRYWAPTDSDNSVHVTVNGQTIKQAWQLPVSGSTWEWQRMPAAFSIPAAGVYTVVIHHREDGLFVDKVGITTDQGYRFSGFGPDVTERLRGAAKGEAWRVGYHEDNRTGQGITAFEAELSTNNIDGRGAYECRRWGWVSDTSASGGRYMTTLNKGQRSDSSDLWSAPRLDFEIELTELDTHFIHIRHKGTYDNNSVWVAVDNSLVGEWHISKNTTGWTWETPNVGFINGRKGAHLLSLIMREDATPIDKIIVTTDRNYKPQQHTQLTTEVVPPNLVYTQQTDGTLELPMEKPSRNLAGLYEYADRRWAVLHDVEAIDGCYVEMPDPRNTQINLKNALSAKAPQLEYDVNFTQIGPHFLYMRHRAANHEDNSYTIYLDGVKVEEVHLNQFSPDAWVYANELPSFEVPSTGRHTISIYGREDGTPLDHVLISPSPALNASAMPIELTDLDAVPRGSDNLVTFTSVYEDNTDYHLIERSSDGRADWNTVGTLAAAGNSSAAIDYRFTDSTPPARAYYRVTTVDLDGSRSTSAIVTVLRKVVATDLSVSVYPNPATDFAALRYVHPTGGGVSVNILDLNGALVATRISTAVKGTNELAIPLQRLTAGTYLLHLDLGAEGVRTERIVVQH